MQQYGAKIEQRLLHAHVQHEKLYEKYGEEFNKENVYLD